jgi:hypothetical protein
MKSGAPFGLVDPILQQVCGCYITMLIAPAMRPAHVRHQLSVIVAQLGGHVEGHDEVHCRTGPSSRHPRPPHEAGPRRHSADADLGHGLRLGLVGIHPTWGFHSFE